MKGVICDWVCEIITTAQPAAERITSRAAAAG